MVLILDGNSEPVAHAWMKIDHFGEKNPICDWSRYNRRTYANQITGIVPFMHIENVQPPPPLKKIGMDREFYGCLKKIDNEKKYNKE